MSKRRKYIDHSAENSDAEDEVLAPMAIVEPYETPTQQSEPVYIGPEYRHGITLPGTTTRIRPRDLSAEEREALIRRYPPAEAWWK